MKSKIRILIHGFCTVFTLFVGDLIGEGRTLQAQTTIVPSSGQTTLSAPSGPSISVLLGQGYNIVAASSEGSAQFLYLQGNDSANRKRAYACQLQFGPSGGFRGCLQLP